MKRNYNNTIQIIDAHVIASNMRELLSRMKKEDEYMDCKNTEFKSNKQQGIKAPALKGACSYILQQINKYKEKERERQKIKNKLMNKINYIMNERIKSIKMEEEKQQKYDDFSDACANFILGAYI